MKKFEKAIIRLQADTSASGPLIRFPIPSTPPVSPPPVEPVKQEIDFESDSNEKESPVRKKIFFSNEKYKLFVQLKSLREIFKVKLIL